MRLLLFSDLHLDAVTAGMRRADDLDLALANVVEIAVSRECDAVACLGDIADPDCGSILVRAVDSMLNMIAVLNSYKKRSYFVAGNHDTVEDGSGVTTLRPLRHSASVVAERPMTVLDPSGLAIILLPYPSRATAYDPELYVRENCKGGELVLGHMTGIDGVEVGSESRDFARGSAMPFPLRECRRQNALFLANGHFHRQQVTAGGIHIPGSLELLRFDEEGNQPGVMIVEV